MLSALQISLVSGLVASVVATPWDLEKRGCGNNCARAVIASAFPNRPTAADCSSYFGATVTPATVTIFETVTGTQSLTGTETASLTITDTITNTLTNFETVTATNTIASTTTKPYVAGRDVSVKTIPTYATACANVAAYQEACGCIGVTPYTVTLPAPLTTVQVPATNTLTFTNTETNTILETNTQSATIVETVPTTATITNVATVTAGPPTCVVPLPVSCTTLAGKTGVALVIQLGVCIAKLIPIYPTVSQNVKTAATTCLAGTNGNSNAANIQACLKAAFQCPA